MNYVFVSLWVLSIVVYSQNLWAQEGKYVSLGSGAFTFSGLKLSPAKNTSSNNVGGRIAMGYKSCMTDRICIGPELGFGYYGQSTWVLDDNTFVLNSMGFDVQLAGNVRLYRSFYSIIKLGAMYNRLRNKAVYTNANVEIISNSDAWQPLLAGGVGYSIKNTLQVEVIFQGTLADEIKVGDLERGSRKSPAVNGYMLSISYRFDD